MSGIKDKETIDQVRQRLYERGKAPTPVERKDLKDNPVENVPTSFQKKESVPKQTPPASDTHAHSTKPVEPTPPADVASLVSDMAPKKKKVHYRLKILLAGVAFFVLALVLSSLFLIFGNNSISGENITIAVTGPFTIGGGEVIPLQVGITNDNAVPIQAATLIVRYPAGTKSATEEGKDLTTERLALETIGSGETVNIPLRAVVFGEENDEKTVDVSIEYRVQGSNATFFKDAETLRFKISSSPIIIRADTLKKVSSGQETDVTLTITSNAQNTLSEVLVKAEYPLGFDYSSSDPDPVTGQNTWLIENLEPESSETITIKGIVIGKETDEYAIHFTVGVPNERDTQSLASVFATTQTEFEIEQPFLDVVLRIDGVADGEVAIGPEDRPRVSIEVENTLQDTIYDAVVSVVMSGNAYSIYNVNPASGYYDSNTDTITWDVSNTDKLESLPPGEKEILQFSIEPASGVSNTPQINIDVDVRARRVSENRVSEELVGTGSSIVKVVSTPVVRGEAGHNNGIFTDVGQVPPVVGEATTYTMSLMIENGSNDVSDAVVTVSLPPYVTWLNETAGAGSFLFNQTNRVLTWNAGDIEANAALFASFQVSFLPTITQVGSIPTLMGEQRVRATDQFTGTVVRDTNPAITTQLSSESGFGSDSGTVRQ